MIPSTWGKHTIRHATLLAVSLLGITACGGEIPPSKMATTSASSDGLATCPSDAMVVGGGYEIDPAARTAGRLPTVVASRPTEHGWKVECIDPEGKPRAACKAFVVCATVLR